MFGNFDDDGQRKQAVMALLIQMAQADQRLDSKEKVFMESVAQQLSITPNQWLEIVEDPDRFVLKPPPSEQERMTILYYVLFTMTSDHQITLKEEQLCYRVGLLLGFSENMTREMILVMKRHLHEPLPENVLIDVIRKHMN